MHTPVPVVEMPDVTWMVDGLCRGRDTDLWFPNSEEDTTPEAVAICGQCPVREQCLAYALAHEDQGVWAGTSARWRRRQRKAAGIRLRTLVLRTRGRDWVEDLRQVSNDTGDGWDEEAAGW